MKVTIGMHVMFELHHVPETQQRSRRGTPLWVPRELKATDRNDKHQP